MREMLEKAEIGQTQFARWLGMTPRAIRRYISGERPVPPAVALLLQLCIEHPDTKDWLSRQAEQRKPATEGEDDDGEPETPKRLRYNRT